ncbi:MAG: RHS repeat-associated core domain-containing protein [Planctomycetota bacterium]
MTTDGVTQNRDHSPLTPGPQNGLNEIVDLKDASNTVTDNLSYDDAGDLTAITPVSGTARNFTWDANSRLKNWAKGATSIDYQYDAYGRRVSDGERRYVYGAGWRVAEERDLSNPQTDITDGSLVAMPLLKTLVYGNYLDEVVQYDTKVNPSYNTAPTPGGDGRDDSGYDSSWTDGKTGEQVYSRTYHIHCDQIYSAKALTNSAGDLAEYYDYTAYGTPTVYKDAGTDANWFTGDDVVSTDGTGNPISEFRNDNVYTEQRWDSKSQQLYYKNRYFDSELGRFIARDPVSIGVTSLFEYVHTDPISSEDGLGLRDHEGVLKILCFTPTGQHTVDIVGKTENLVVYKTDRIESQKHTRAHATDPWGPITTDTWGGMTTRDDKHNIVIHVPSGYSDLDAAIVLSHESMHAQGLTEVFAYTTETQFEIELEGNDENKTALAQSGFVRRDMQFTKVVNGVRKVDEDLVLAFIHRVYEGWYDNSNMVEYVDFPGGHRVRYVNPVAQYPWYCGCENGNVSHGSRTPTYGALHH